MLNIIECNGDHIHSTMTLADFEAAVAAAAPSPWVVVPSKHHATDVTVNAMMICYYYESSDCDDMIA